MYGSSFWETAATQNCGHPQGISLTSLDKTKSWSGLKLSSADGDWDVNLEQWREYQGYYCEIFKQSCKVQRFNQRDRTKSWSGLKLSSADGDGDVSWDWNVADVTAKKFKQSCQFLYISNWWTHYNSSSRFIGWFPQQQDRNQMSIWRTSDRVTHRRFQLNWSDWEMELNFIVIKQTE